MAIKRLQNLYFVVQDMDRADTFYRRVLGATPKFRDGNRWAQYSVGGANFSLASAAEAPSGFAGCMPVYEVDDLDAARAEIVDAGGSVDNERDMGAHGRTLTLRDAEGHWLQLFARAV